MPRRRSNDTQGVSDVPNYVTDPVRKAELVAEYQRRLAHITASYLRGKASQLDNRTFNQSLARLKKAVGRPKVPGHEETRLHPWLEVLINHRARKIAGLEPNEFLGNEYNDAVQAAAAEVAKMQPMRGRPAHDCLRYHVEALMALIQESGGRAVWAQREKGSVYDPQLAPGNSRIISIVFQSIDPEVTTTQLANIVRAARRKHAGKPMRFMDYFPFYGGSIDPATLAPTPAAGYQLEYHEIARPIYCP